MRAVRLVLLTALALVLLLPVSCTPSVNQTQAPTEANPGPGRKTPLPPRETPAAALPERRSLILEWPASMREKDSEIILLTIAMDEGGKITATAPSGETTTVEIPNLYDTHAVLAIARLDLAGVEAYREDVREPLLPGKTVVFRWAIRPQDAGLYRGVVWLRLEFIPRAGGEIVETLLMAKQIEIKVVSVLGLPADLARIFGAVGIVASTLLGFPFISSWIEKWMKRRKSPRAAAGSSKDAEAGSRQNSENDAEGGEVKRGGP